MSDSASKIIKLKTATASGKQEKSTSNATVESAAQELSSSDTCRNGCFGRGAF
ncbi:hypothetical protein [Borreliella garinii]|uniref:hypothetical protein n=1 Tax=Borreliella garinii TaxID=29519 RepID=UPI00040FB4FA|nr:hypothetical protein [Borreliella garinii]